MKKTLKGFTLIELIVVMAIFMVILTAVGQFVPTASKTMNFADIRNEGDAVVENIGSYLEGQLQAVEYVDIYNTMSGVTPAEAAKEFVEKYYEGVLSTSATLDSPSWASGKVHVLTIDNNNNGKISHYSFDCGFEPGNISVSGGMDEEWAVNKAYYDAFPASATDPELGFRISIGTFDDTSDPALIDPSLTSYEELSRHLSAKNTQFTIRAATQRGGTLNPQKYAFSTTASMSMINIVARGGGGVKTYYVMDFALDPEDTTVIKRSIVPITASPMVIRDQDTEGISIVGGRSLAREYGTLTSASSLYYTPAGDANSDGCYTFVYSYAPEINVS